jgi:hypothetical protein
MRVWARRSLAGLAVAALVGAVAMLTAATASAQGKQKSVKTEAEWIRFDPEAKTVTVKVKKPGSGKEARRLRKNQEAVFKVKPEGSVMTRTTVTINGRKAEFTDIPDGKLVNVYWRPDPDDDSVLFARKIDAILSEDEIYDD